MRGHLYVLSNPAMPGLLKIGYTTRSVQERITELSSTGVPRRFQLEFCMEVERVDSVESVLHRRLSRHRFGKEFFKIETTEAVRVCKLSILEGTIECHSYFGRASASFLTEQEKIDAEAARLKKIADAEAARLRDREAKELERQKAEEFDELRGKLWLAFENHGKTFNQVLKTRTILGSGSPLRTALGLGLILTGVGMLVADHVIPPAYDDGLKSASKLTKDEIEIAKRFYEIYLQTKSYKLGGKARYNEDRSLCHDFETELKNKLGKENYLFDGEYGGLSLLAAGLLTGLGIFRTP